MQTIAYNIALNKQVDLILFILKFALYREDVQILSSKD